MFVCSKIKKKELRLLQTYPRFAYCSGRAEKSNNCQANGSEFLVEKNFKYVM
jgi:hypothetical protein